MSERKPYSEKLADPRWQKKRLEVMNYANWRCQICGDKKTELHCHHSYYTRGKEPWQYPKGAIICICKRCHDKIHNKDDKKPSALNGDWQLSPAVLTARAMLNSVEQRAPEPGDYHFIGPLPYVAPPSRFAMMKAMLERV